MEKSKYYQEGYNSFKPENWVECPYGLDLSNFNYEIFRDWYLGHAQAENDYTERLFVPFIDNLNRLCRENNVTIEAEEGKIFLTLTQGNRRFCLDVDKFSIFAK